MKDYDKNNKSSHLKYWDGNNLYGRAMSEKLQINKFEQIKHVSKFNELHMNKNMKILNFVTIYHFT